MKTKIIYEDEALLVIYKPAGIATQTSKIGQADVVSELKNYLASKASAKEVYLGIVHRLDQPVEGLLVFGKTKAATAKLSAQLGQGSLNKKYYAVIGGQPSEKEGKLVDKMYKNTDNRAVVVSDLEAGQMGGQQAVPAPKEAILQYRIVQEVVLPHTGHNLFRSKETDIPAIKELSTKNVISLADIHIETGRFHQIRAQMAYHGMALLGDAKYADEATSKLSQQLFVRNVALCAYSLEVQHPITKHQLSFQKKPEGKLFQRFQLDDWMQ